MNKTKRIGIYGGTFNPVHMGHIRAAQTFLAEVSPDTLYIMPTAVSPHKQMSGNDSPAARLAMLRLAFSDAAFADPRIVVSDYEQTRGGKSYTILTLEHFRKESDDIWLLCGTDMFLTLENWYRGADILKSFSVVCLCRETDDREYETIGKTAERYRTTYGTRLLLPHTEPVVVSSTEIRERIKNGMPTDGLLPDSVRAYIDAHGLYRI